MIIIIFYSPSVVKILRAQNIKLNSKVDIWLEVRKTELKRYTMTESLWNKYDISRKSPEVPVKCSHKVVRKERALALNAPWQWTAMGWKIHELVRPVLELCADELVVGGGVGCSYDRRRRRRRRQNGRESTGTAHSLDRRFFLVLQGSSTSPVISARPMAPKR